MTSAFFGPFWTPPAPRQQILDFCGPPPLSACVRFLRLPITRNEIFHFGWKNSFFKPLTEQKKEYLNGLLNDLNHLLNFSLTQSIILY